MQDNNHASAVATQEATDEDSNVLRGKTASEAAVAIRKPADAGNGYRATGLAIALSLSDDTGQDKASGRALLSMPVASFVATGTALAGRLRSLARGKKGLPPPHPLPPQNPPFGAGGYGEGQAAASPAGEGRFFVIGERP